MNVNTSMAESDKMLASYWPPVKQVPASAVWTISLFLAAEQETVKYANSDRNEAPQCHEDCGYWLVVRTGVNNFVTFVFAITVIFL
jgi:hypothetical protein